mgnify:CR=1 FL=1
MKEIGILVCFLMMFLLCSCSLISSISIRNKCENHLKEHLEEMENDRTLKIEMATIYQLDNEYGCILTVKSSLLTKKEQFFVNIVKIMKEVS